MVETTSSLATYAKCPRMYEYKYEKLFDPRGYPSALVVGIITHAIAEDTHKNQDGVAMAKAMEEINRRWSKPEYAERLKFDVNYATTIGRAWAKYWSENDSDLGNKRLKWLAVEREWSFEIGNNTNNYRLAGKSDGYVEHENGKRFLYELKTASDREREAYVTLLQNNAQVNNNIIALQRDNLPCDGVIYDIAWKPLLRHKKEETEEEFQERMVKTMAENPEKTFSRVMLFRNQTTLDEHLPDLAAQFQHLEMSRKGGYYFRNTGSCRVYNVRCQFFDMCIDNNKDMEEFFDRKQRRHSELSEEIQNGT